MVVVSKLPQDVVIQIHQHHYYQMLIINLQEQLKMYVDITVLQLGILLLNIIVIHQMRDLVLLIIIQPQLFQLLFRELVHREQL